jgi:hypothetical protein
VSYHPECVRVGEPFQTRRDDEGGLQFPAQALPGLFICEACTVRCVLKRELRGGRDHHLLSLERMRLLDVAHSWAPGSFKSYQPYLRAVRRFQEDWGVHIIPQPNLRHPPCDPTIPLMWCQEAYGLRPGRRRGNGDSDQVSFATIRQLRAAVAHHEAWVHATAHPGTGYYDQNRRLLHQECRATDTACLSLFARGLAARTGTESKPSKSLLHRHVVHLHNRLDRLYREQVQTASNEELSNICLAGFLNLSLWLGWLRSSESFGLNQEDVNATLPQEGGTLDLPDSTGAIQLRLRPETKSNRNSRADMILAFTSGSGLPLGEWYLRVQEHRTGPRTQIAQLFCHEDGTPWDSGYFRNAYLYPSLHAQRAAGDVYLVPLDGLQGPTIEEAFWGLASYRNGARSCVSRARVYALPHSTIRLRKASDAEVYEHGRWRHKRQNEDIDKVYQQWTFRDRITITTECM